MLGPTYMPGGLGGGSGRTISRLRQPLPLSAGAEDRVKPGIASGMNSGPGRIWGPFLGLLLLSSLVLARIF